MNSVAVDAGLELSPGPSCCEVVTAAPPYPHISLTVFLHGTLTHSDIIKGQIFHLGRMGSNCCLRVTLG